MQSCFYCGMWLFFYYVYCLFLEIEEQFFQDYMDKIFYFNKSLCVLYYFVWIFGFFMKKDGNLNCDGIYRVLRYDNMCLIFIFIFY